MNSTQASLLFAGKKQTEKMNSSVEFKEGKSPGPLNHHHHHCVIDPINSLMPLFCNHKTTISTANKQTNKKTKRAPPVLM